MDVDGAVIKVLRDGQPSGPAWPRFAETPLRAARAPPSCAPATAGWPPPCLLPRGREPDDATGPSPSCSTPTAVPTPSGSCAAGPAFLSAQWLADQGFAVVVADGRGTPGRGTEWERAIHRDLATPVLDDQIDALHARRPTSAATSISQRVGIRGWSFGGYLAALAVLRRPDVFHAAVAGAPVTEWELYDTHYTERYLGNPASDEGPYERTSLSREAQPWSGPCC